MDFIEVSAKTVDDAITEACQKFTVTSDKLEFEVIDEGKAGLLGIGAKPAIIKVRVKSSMEDKAKDFLKDVFAAMNLTVVCDVKYDEAESTMDIELSGDEMGILIGKRGQTLDSLQYLVSLVVNKDVENYVRVKWIRKITAREGKIRWKIWQRTFPIRLRGQKGLFRWSL